MIKIAIPVYNQKLTAHFGHCQNFAVVNTSNNKIDNIEYLDPPVHQPGVYPKFLADQGVKVIIAGGMGQKAQDLFHQNNIEVIIGVHDGTPMDLAKQYLDGILTSGNNLCDH